MSDNVLTEAAGRIFRLSVQCRDEKEAKAMKHEIGRQLAHKWGSLIVDLPDQEESS